MDNHNPNLLVETITVGPLSANCYIFGCLEDRVSIVIDPGGEPEKIIRSLKGKDLTPIMIINTHGHADHTAGNRSIKEHYDIPITIHEGDAAFITSTFNAELSQMYGGTIPIAADKTVKGGEEIRLCEHYSLKVIHTPGHSRGGICLLWSDILFTGDTLFAQSIGRSDLPGGSSKELLRSIKERLLPLGDSIKIFPGHGPSSTIKEERLYNPFLT